MSQSPDSESRFNSNGRFGDKKDTPTSTIKKVGGPLAVVGVLLAKFGSLLLPLVKILSLGKFAAIGSKFLVTGGSMLLSIWFYAQRWGWKFAAGFVISILIHELGHVYMAWRKGVPITAPLFIPGFGAMILQKRSAKTKWDDAMIGIGGPIAGTAAGLTMLFIGLKTGNDLFTGLAYTTFFLNLFNLLPIMPLDGGWVVRAISPLLFIAGLAGMIWLFFIGYLHNPFILMIVILAVPGMIHSFKSRNEPELEIEATKSKKFMLGGAYLVLCFALLMLMEISKV